jgi:GT2 family glycosyltransferase
MTKPFFSVLILFWKSAQYLQANLQALEEQTFKDFEVILLDNGADEPPDPALVSQHPNLNLHLLRSETNLGFAGGNNLAARQAQGDYLVLLNNDAFPEPDWLATIHQTALSHPNCCFASRLLKADNPNLLDGEWNVYHASGLAWRKNHNRSISFSSTEPRHVISACAAASAYPRSAFKQVSGFDEDFFAYMEDIDLDLRLRLAGYDCLYLPEAVVHHVGSGSTGSRSDFSTFYGHRNLVWAFVKNMPGLLLWLLLPAHLLVNIAYLLAGLFMPNGKKLWQAKKAAIVGLPKIWRKRQLVQSKRTSSIWYFAKLLNWNPVFPFTKLFYRDTFHKKHTD